MLVVLDHLVEVEDLPKNKMPPIALGRLPDHMRMHLHEAEQWGHQLQVHADHVTIEQLAVRFLFFTLDLYCACAEHRSA